jgi:hypothetical protein
VLINKVSNESTILYFSSCVFGSLNEGNELTDFELWLDYKTDDVKISGQVASFAIVCVEQEISRAHVLSAIDQNIFRRKLEVMRGD